METGIAALVVLYFIALTVVGGFSESKVTWKQKVSSAASWAAMWIPYVIIVYMLICLVATLIFRGK